MWPKGINVLKAMKEMREPDDSWIKFDLVKLKFSSAKKRECEEYNLTTTAEFSSSEEDEPARRQRKKKKYDDFVTGIEQTSRSTHEESQTQKKTHNSGSRGLGLSRPPQQPPKKRFTSELSADVDSGKSSKDSRASSAEPMRQKKTTVTSLPTLRRSPRKQVEPRRVQQPSEPHESLSQAARRTAPSHQESSPENSDMEAETHLPQLQRQKKTTVTSLSTLRRSPRKQVETRKVQQPSEPHGSLSQAARRTAPSHQESSPENSDMEAETHLPQLQSPPTSSKRTGGYPMSTERFQRRVIQLLVEIRDNVRQGHVGGRSVEDLGTFVVREYDTLEDFLLFDDSLMETELQKSSNEESWRGDCWRPCEKRHEKMPDKWFNGENEYARKKGKICICVNNSVQIDQREHPSEPPRCHGGKGLRGDESVFKVCPRTDRRRRKTKIVMLPNQKEIKRI
ncbi:SRRM2 protein homolog rsr-2-like isoform X2 [Saccostrea cucullata]|uniref:SRRM2 protein homolog rsr-2-like isoform X2 n=1 Tax=Saccostrea cuccullata TaxID=36930 RepID=UPI002ED451C6